MFGVIRKLTSEGLSVILITHKLKEVMEISDRVTILRLGKKIDTVETKNVTPTVLANMMVGREVIFSNFEKKTSQSFPILNLENITYSSKNGKKNLNGINLTVHQGEVLGIAGVDGNGQSELAKIVTGLLKPNSGEIMLAGKIMNGKKAIDFINAKVAHIPEDRNLMGLAGKLSIIDNLVLKKIDQKPFSSYKGWRINHKVIRDHGKGLVAINDVRCSGVDCATKDLSGGNQQKVIIARELEKIPLLLVAVHPTRGLDIGATDFVHSEIIRARDEGATVLLISSDLDEVFRLSDRIACIYEGKIMGIVAGLSENMEQVGLMMAGTTSKEEVS
jgi:simple sugar transport system ATP-binding protein